LLVSRQLWTPTEAVSSRRQFGAFQVWAQGLMGNKHLFRTVVVAPEGRKRVESSVTPVRLGDQRRFLLAYNQELEDHLRQTTPTLDVGTQTNKDRRSEAHKARDDIKRAGKLSQANGGRRLFSGVQSFYKRRFASITCSNGTCPVCPATCRVTGALPHPLYI
jgi:hypothetical protein